jgi:energy-coupling factor transport system permease protein
MRKDVRTFEFFRNVSIGQYIDTGSYVHLLRPSTKYLCLACLAAPALAAGPAGVALSLAVALASGHAARVRVSFLLRGLKPALPFFALTAILQFLFGWPNDESLVLLRLGPISITVFELRLVLMAIARCVALVAAIGLFTSTTTESEIAHGIEDSLEPLARLGLPVHRLALAVTTAFRFVPIVAGELEAIVKAQASRGGDFGSGRGGPIAKARAYLPLFVPVTIRALERAEALAEAMEARCYSGDGRTRYVVYERASGEGLVRLGALGLCAAAFAAGALL